MLWRQGDLFIQPAPGVPAGAALQADQVVAEGEVTGHKHRVLDPHSAQLFRFHDDFYLDVVADYAQLVHDEHETLWLEFGIYRIWRQREYEPGLYNTTGARYVID